MPLDDDNLLYSVNILVGKMGKGKTLTGVNAILEHREIHPNSEIFANLHLWENIEKQIPMKNFTYSPLMIFPYSKIEKLKNCFILIDDFSNLKNSKNIASLICNISRKMNITILITCQRIKQVHPKIREVCLFYDSYTFNSIKCEYIKSKDLIELTCYNEFSPENIINNEYIETYYYTNVSKAFKCYDTNEIVPYLTENDVIQEIIKFSDNQRDLDVNLEACFNNRTIRNKIFNVLVKKYPKFQS